MNSEINLKLAEFERILSKDRIAVYLKLSNNNKIVAYRLYKLNCELSIILYEILGHLEIILRNSLVKEWNIYFENAYKVQNEPWPLETTNIKKYSVTYRFDLDAHDRDIVTATRKFNDYIVRKQTPDRKMTNGDLISNLNFGFWSNCFKDSYMTINKAKIYKIFPKAPTNPNREKGVKEIRKKIYKSYQLRNRIAHHEPIINSKDLLIDFNAAMELIDYIHEDYVTSFLKGKGKKFTKIFQKIAVTKSKFYI